MSCGVGHKCGLDMALLWLWCGPAAVAPIRPLGWELPYAADAALEKTKKKTKTKTLSISCSNHNYHDCCVSVGLVYSPSTM